MVGEGMPRRLGGNPLEGVFRAAVCMLFGQHVMCMVVDDRERLDDPL
jgi:hypothetical protein